MYNYDVLKQYAIYNSLTYAFMARRTGKSTLAVELANYFQEETGNCLLVVATLAMKNVLMKRYGGELHAEVCTMMSYSLFKNKAVRVFDDCTPGLPDTVSGEKVILSLGMDSAKTIILRTPHIYDADGRCLRRNNMEHWRIWSCVPHNPAVSIEFHAAQRWALFDGFGNGDNCHEIRLRDQAL